LIKSSPYGLFHRPTLGTNCLRSRSLEAEPCKGNLFPDLFRECSQERKRIKVRKGTTTTKKMVSGNVVSASDWFQPDLTGELQAQNTHRVGYLEEGRLTFCALCSFIG
jgi:hypothetical protein